ncbi:hypothetical protein WICMUC_003158 [Wickerhamomyces mucosus]|uniref:peptidyl-tRNA hydrolase n=1 Tax=Wickerhamomyces mucosus TaxID=1378264 RepID=A0A9P8PM71_9ASCO|nr:hypothetical protein WICMUC_003158 [Wickerhamomyces mucosus]
MGHLILDQLINNKNNNTNIQQSFQEIPNFNNVSININKQLYSNVIFLKNLNFMNISGNALIPVWNSIINKYKNNTDQSINYKVEILVIYDELEKEVGKYQLRFGKVSSRGHNGLKSIVNGFGNEFYRLGVGIGRPNRLNNQNYKSIANYVLDKIPENDWEKIQYDVIPKIEEIIDELRS